VASGRWFVNDALNVLAPQHQARMRAELRPPNVVFGLHRWYAGGRSPDRIALSSVQQWEAELDRSRAGDNLVLVSLHEVRERAIGEAGDLSSLSPPILPAALEARFLGFLRRAGELAVVHRHLGADGSVRCGYDVVWDPSPEDWAEWLERWSSLNGELLFFDDDEILWREKGARGGGSPEEWPGRYAGYLFDGYVPNGQGQVVAGGAY
jgi:hypothetical protein